MFVGQAPTRESLPSQFANGDASIKEGRLTLIYWVSQLALVAFYGVESSLS